MAPQYLAARLSCGQRSAASVSQSGALPVSAYLFQNRSFRFGRDCTHAIKTSKRGQAGRVRAVCFVEPDRSRRCLRASSCLPCSRSSRAFPLAHSRKKKSTSWSTLSPSVSSPCTQASTSKYLSGRADVSVPYLCPGLVGSQNGVFDETPLTPPLATWSRPVLSGCLHPEVV
jgi:hypothetical protein